MRAAFCRLDRVTLPSDADAQQDPTSTLIMRSSGMAIEMLDKHGRSMHYTSRVRRQRVYIKTGAAVLRVHGGGWRVFMSPAGHVATRTQLCAHAWHMAAVLCVRLRHKCLPWK